MAHQTDEYCLLSRLAEAERLYGDLIRDWMANRPRRKPKCVTVSLKASAMHSAFE